MKSVILHIGPHKTGSTYLQYAFAHHRQALRERGIVFPLSWQQGPHEPSHTRLVQLARSDTALAPLDALLGDENLAHAETLLISAEDLAGLKAPALARLQGLFDGLGVTVVNYVRRWSDRLPSGWQEGIKQGGCESFPEFFSMHSRNPETTPLFNLDLQLGPWVEAFGRQSLKIVSYSLLRERDIDLFCHFARHFLAWPDASPPPAVPPLNASRGAREIELLRQLNLIEVEQVGSSSAALRNRLDAAWNAIETAAIFEAMQRHARTLAFSDAYPALQALHIKLRQQYSNGVVPPMPQALLFPPRKQELPYIADGYLHRPGILDKIHAIHRQIAAG